MSLGSTSMLTLHGPLKSLCLNADAPGANAAASVTAVATTNGLSLRKRIDRPPLLVVVAHLPP
jgi:hypothetical protein